MKYFYPENSILLAPLAGFTDLPYRNSARRFGCKYAFAEMVDAGSLVYGNAKTFRFMERGDNEEWLGAQFLGSNPEILSKATQIMNEYNFDVLDFNLGCPAPKVVKKGAGAALGLRPDDAIRAFDSIVKLSRFPVTAKIRILDEQDPAPTVDLCKRLEASGAKAITIHGRIKDKFYAGDVFHDVIDAVREEVDIQIIANGGVMGTESYDAIREQTGCESVMLARGAMGNPWIFKLLLDPETFLHPTAVELAEEMETHILNMIDYYNESLALKIGRKVILDYLKGRGYGGTMKSRVSKICKLDDFKGFIDDIKQGPNDSYWDWLNYNPDAERQLRQV